MRLMYRECAERETRTFEIRFCLSSLLCLTLIKALMKILNDEIGEIRSTHFLLSPVFLCETATPRLSPFVARSWVDPRKTDGWMDGWMIVKTRIKPIHAMRNT